MLDARKVRQRVLQGGAMSGPAARALLGGALVLAAACDSSAPGARPVELLRPIEGPPPALRGVGGTRRLGWEVTIPGRLEFPLSWGAEASLRLSLAFLEGGPRSRTRVRLVQASTSGREAVLHQEVLDPVALGPRWKTLRLAVGAWAASLRLEAEAVGRAPLRARLLVGTPLLAPLGVPPVAPSAVLIVVDALRADHLGSYGYARPTSPAIDALAAEGIRFARATTSGPMTVPSMPQMFTGRFFPRREGVLSAAVARARPVNAAIVTNPFVAAWLSLAMEPPFGTIVDLRADAMAVTTRALGWLDEQPAGPFFLFVHYLDPHTPYRPPEEFARRFVDPAAPTTVGLTFADVAGARAGRYDAHDRRRVVDLYDAEIAYTDHAIGELVAGLRARGRLDHTAIVLTADHGEELWDHGGFFHGQSLYEELLHVPLIVRPAGGAVRAQTAAELAGSVDVLPTILEALGLPVPAGIPGRPAATRGRPAGRELIAAAVNDANPIRLAARSTRHKYVVSLEDGAEELYDLDRDPDERTNLVGEAGEVLARLRTALARETAWLGTEGVQLRLRGVSGTAVRYRVRIRVQATGRETFVSFPFFPWRIDLEEGDRIVVSRRGRQLVWRGRLDDDEDGMRIDCVAPPLGAAACPVELDLRVDDRRARPTQVRVGPASRAAGAIPLRVRLGRDIAAGEPTAEAPSEPTLMVWRGAETVAPTLSPDALPADARERLRALGYVD